MVSCWEARRGTSLRRRSDEASDRRPGFELEDPIFEEQDLFVLGIDIHGGQLFQATPSCPSGPLPSEDGSLDDEGDGSTDNVKVLRHGF